MKKILLCLLALAAGLGMQAQDRLYADEFPLGDVTLLEGPLRHARDLNIATLMQYDVDRLLAPYRKEAGLTQEELARKVYVTRQAISRWETGETTPSIDMTKLLASALGVPVMRLLDLPSEPSCQCCGTPFSVPNQMR